MFLVVSYKLLVESLEECLDDFPPVTREAALAALDLARASLVNQLG
jgi:hypothetical protein